MYGEFGKGSIIEVQGYWNVKVRRGINHQVSFPLTTLVRVLIIMRKRGVGYLRLRSRWTMLSGILNFKPYAGVLSTTKTHSQGIMSLIKDSSY